MSLWESQLRPSGERILAWVEHVFWLVEGNIGDAEVLEDGEDGLAEVAEGNGAGDNAAAAVGTGIVFDGRAFTTIGTSGVVFAHTSKPRIDPKGRVHTFCCAVPGCWHVMGVTQAAGLSLRWFRDNLAETYKDQAVRLGVDSYDLINQEVAKVPIGSRRLIYLPYLMGERTPHLNPNCRAVFFGLSAIHTKADMLRAVMEGVSYSLLDCFDILREMKVNVNEMMACGGGKSRIWRQMLADMYGCEVKTIKAQEGPARLSGFSARRFSRSRAASLALPALSSVLRSFPSSIRSARLIRSGSMPYSMPSSSC